MTLSDHQHFPWGYQIRADFHIDGKTYQEVLIFKTTPIRIDSKAGWVLEWALPSKAEIDEAVLVAEARILKMLADEVASLAPKVLGYQITNEDGTVVTI
jgi:hypothetical protein